MITRVDVAVDAALDCDDDPLQQMTRHEHPIHLRLSGMTTSSQSCPYNAVIGPVSRHS
jgi:hypothetical protein